MTALTVTYEFDCLEIEIDGIRVGSFTGTAVLEEDGSDFYVSRISLEGEKVERRPGQMIPSRRNAAVALARPSLRRDYTFEDHLFEAIETALYSSRDAAEFWAEQLAMEFAA